MVFQYTGAFPSSNIAQEGSAYSLVSSKVGIVTVAAAFTVPLILINFLFFRELLRNEAPIKLLTCAVDKDGFAFPVELYFVADKGRVEDANIDVLVAAINGTSSSSALTS